MTRRLLVWPLLGVLTLAAWPSIVAAESPERQVILSARGLLMALEEADADIDRLQADIRYLREQKLQGDLQVRDGTLYFRRLADPDSPGGQRRAFAVYFDTLYVPPRREEDLQMWIFDGEWLIEQRPAVKQYTARQVAPPGANFDPLRLGEGPLPIPIGQKADEVLARYDAELLGPLEGAALAEGAAERVRDRAHQLRLTPKPARARDAEFREIRLWYDKDSLLPIMARTLKRGGDVATVLLTNTQVNPDQFDRSGVFNIAPPPPGAGWEVDIQEHRGD